ncbi:hypothetical protein BS47DRAFT_1300897 [Hydnum rufescens UP504]|uniref:Peptidase S54 rhomboid domain-containing protein n=1 Tax=Hydnum rufescens UP504 TaxID=1448309 RepID=A0A9P6DST4_9AGAM|nr:hypothetical protein BS47DRAFT_1300897 [Hydnum rufescens UP504]
MSFAHAPVSKGMMIGFGISSLLAAIFDVKHYFHLQLVPHVSRDHQYWRLLTHQLVVGNSSELLVLELLLYNVSLHIERSFGGPKCECILPPVSLMLSSLLSFVSLLVFHRLGLNHIPAGPVSLIMSIVYQHARIVPPSYTFRIMNFDLTNKIFIYILALQLVIYSPPGSVAAAGTGILAGILYRSDFVGLKRYRLSGRFQSFSSRFLVPLIGSTQAPRRHNRALPDEVNWSAGRDVVTTAPASRSAQAQNSPAPRTSSVLNQWVDELTGRGQASGMRVPTNAEIGQLAVVFPDAPRDAIVTALQRRSAFPLPVIWRAPN